MAESEITTRIEVITDTSELDTLPTDGVFSFLDDVVKDIKVRLDEGAKKLAEEAAIQLIKYEETYFNEPEHPFETGTGRDSFYATSESDKVWVVDNSAENNGFPYMVMEELRPNAGATLVHPVGSRTTVLPPHPFAKPGREALLSDIESLAEECINL